MIDTLSSIKRITETILNAISRTPHSRRRAWQISDECRPTRFSFPLAYQHWQVESTAMVLLVQMWVDQSPARTPSSSQREPTLDDGSCFPSDQSQFFRGSTHDAFGVKTNKSGFCQLGWCFPFTIGAWLAAKVKRLLANTRIGSIPKTHCDEM